MNSEYVFVSMLGTQIMGTLQPLMVLADWAGPVHSHLLLTAEMKPSRQLVEEFIRDNNLGTVEFTDSDRTKGTDDTKLVVEIAREASAQGKRVCFNVNGGLNFFVANCTLALEPFQPLYIQTSLWRGVIHDTRDNVYWVRPLPRALAPEEILRLQRAEYEVNVPNPDTYPLKPWKQYAEERGIQAPNGALCNVSLGGIVFDYVWNPGNNRLYFFKDWRLDMDRDERRMRERDLAHWSNDRKRSAHLQDKEVVALVPSEDSARRLGYHSSEKLLTVRADAMSLDKQKKPVSPEVKLQQTFHFKLPKSQQETLSAPKGNDCTPMKDDTLVLAIGTNILPTLKAICSQRPKHVVLCYGTGTPRVREAAERIRDMAPGLGLESVQIAKLTAEGNHPEVALPKAEPGAKVRVNITPGTKGHTVALTRWAMQEGHEVWSIYNQGHCCAPLSGGVEAEKMPLRLCDPALVLKIGGANLFEEGRGVEELAEEKEGLNAMLRFMRAAHKSGVDLDAIFAAGHCELGYCKASAKKGIWKITLDGKKYTFEKEDRGRWYEKLCAQALLNAGASQVRLNAIVGWPEGTKKHMEVDVLASLGGDLVLLSAKGYKLKERYTPEEWQKCSTLVTKDEAIKDARNTAMASGQFALSVVAHTGVSEALGEDKVVLLGWSDICYPENLRSCIDLLRRSKSTTNPKAQKV